MAESASLDAFAVMDEDMHLLTKAQRKKLEKEREAKEEPKGAKAPSLFDYINDLSYGKKNLAETVRASTGSFPKDISTYMLNKAFGNYADTVLYANALNSYGNVTDEMAHVFYLHALPAKKRFAKWYKEDETEIEKLSRVSRYFKWGRNETMENIRMLDRSEIERICSLYDNENENAEDG